MICTISVRPELHKATQGDGQEAQPLTTSVTWQGTDAHGIMAQHSFLIQAIAMAQPKTYDLRRPLGSIPYVRVHIYTYNTYEMLILI